MKDKKDIEITIKNETKEFDNIINETKEFDNIIRKIIELAPVAKSKQEKEIVNNYIDMAQNHYNNIYNLLNKTVNIINGTFEDIYNEIKINVEPNTNLPPLHKLKMFERKGIFTKLIIEDDKK